MALQDFLEELKRNAKEAADITVKKTSEMTAIAKATVAIKNEESKLSACYKEIGRLFYTAERDGVDHTDDIATFIMQADKIKAAIAGYQKEIAALKKVAICDSCGGEIPADAQFCPSCGAKIVKPVQEECHCCCCDTEPAEKEEACACTCDDTCGCEDTCTCEDTCECAQTEEKAEENVCPCCCGDIAETETAEEDKADGECACESEAEHTHHCCCCEDTAETYETPEVTEPGEERSEE